MARLASASFAPLAAAAVVVAISVAIITLGSFAGRSGGPADGRPGGLPSRPSHFAASQAPGLNSPWPPAGMPLGTVRAKQTYPGQVGWTAFWPGGAGMPGQICAETAVVSTGSQATPTGMYGMHCGRASLPHGRLVSWLGADMVTLNTSDSVGIAARRVASVTVVLPGGRQVRGVVASGSSLPCKVWVVSYGTWHAAHTTLVFRDAAGHEVASVSRGEAMTGINLP